MPAGLPNATAATIGAQAGEWASKCPLAYVAPPAPPPSASCEGADFDAIVKGMACPFVSRQACEESCPDDLVRNCKDKCCVKFCAAVCQPAPMLPPPPPPAPKDALPAPAAVCRPGWCWGASHFASVKGETYDFASSGVHTLMAWEGSEDACAGVPLPGKVRRRRPSCGSSVAVAVALFAGGQEVVITESLVLVDNVEQTIAAGETMLFDGGVSVTGAAENGASLTVKFDGSNGATQALEMGLWAMSSPVSPTGVVHNIQLNGGSTCAKDARGLLVDLDTNSTVPCCRPVRGSAWRFVVSQLDEQCATPKPFEGIMKSDPKRTCDVTKQSEDSAKAACGRYAAVQSPTEIALAAAPRHRRRHRLASRAKAQALVSVQETESPLSPVARADATAAGKGGYPGDAGSAHRRLRTRLLRRW